MKYLSFVALILLAVCQTSFSQDKAKIKAEAIISANAFAKGNYAVMADHTYPKMLAMMGGKEAFVKLLSTQMGTMKKQGLSVEKVVIGEPGQIYTAGTELHCLVPQTVTVKMQGKYVTSTTHLLAVSDDKGKTWTFVDTSNGSPEKMKQMFPNWNSKLVIPPPTKPVFSDKMP